MSDPPTPHIPSTGAPPSGTPTNIRAVIFDLDGVLVSTDQLHLSAWRDMAARWDFPFPESIADDLRGVSRMESLDIILRAAGQADRFDDAQRQEMAAWKNDRYRRQLESLTPDDILPGAMPLLRELRARGIRLAVGSSSRNARAIMDRIGLTPLFDAIIDGNDITRGKPGPEVFLLAARRLGFPPHQCVVVEDAASGIEAALAAGCPVVAIGAAAGIAGAALSARDVSRLTADTLASIE